METLVKADIFFFITAAAVVIVAIIIVVAGYYLIQILKNFRDISNKIKKGADVAEEDLKNIHGHVTTSPLLNFIFGKRSKAKKKKVEKE